MPLPVVAAIVVYCTTFTTCVILFHAWGLKFIGEKAAVIAFIPAILAFAWML